MGRGHVTGLGEQSRQGWVQTSTQDPSRADRRVRPSHGRSWAPMGSFLWGPLSGLWIPQTDNNSALFIKTQRRRAWPHTQQNAWGTFIHKNEWTIQFSRSVESDSLRPHESQHARPPCPSPTPGVYSNPCPSSWWCHPIFSSSVIPFPSCPQSLPASGSFPMSQLFTWGGQSTGVSALASVLPMNTQDWSPLGWTSWISLQSKGLSRVFSNTTVQTHQLFSTQLSSQSNSHIHTWPLEKP